MESKVAEVKQKYQEQVDKVEKKVGEVKDKVNDEIGKATEKLMEKYNQAQEKIQETKKICGRAEPLLFRCGFRRGGPPDAPPLQEFCRKC